MRPSRDVNEAGLSPLGERYLQASRRLERMSQDARTVVERTDVDKLGLQGRTEVDEAVALLVAAASCSVSFTA